MKQRWLSVCALLVAWCCIAGFAYAEEAATAEPDTSRFVEPPTGTTLLGAAAQIPSSVGLGALRFGRNIFEDLSLQIQSPFRYAKNNPVKFAMGTLGVMALVATDHRTHAALTDGLDADTQKHAQRLSDAVDRRNGLYLIVGLGALGIVSGSSREKRSAVMLTESILTTALWTDAIKVLSGRERPRETEAIKSDWEGPAFLDDDRESAASLRSFPSGHTSTTFAMATVLAHQYPTHGIVPVLAYGGATAMAYSRMVVGAHWLSDVVVGAMLGYGSARCVIANHERRAEESEQSSLRLGLNISSAYKGAYLNYTF